MLCLFHTAPWYSQQIKFRPSIDRRDFREKCPVEYIHWSKKIPAKLVTSQSSGKLAFSPNGFDDNEPRFRRIMLQNARNIAKSKQYWPPKKFVAAVGTHSPIFPGKYPLVRNSVSTDPNLPVGDKSTFKGAFFR